MTRALYAEFTAADTATADRIAVLLATLSQAVRSEPGNLVFDGYRRDGTPLEFFVYEVYMDEAAFRTHIAQDHCRVFNTELSSLIEGDGSTLTFLEPL